MKRYTMVLGALALVAAAVGCTPSPEPDALITCDGISAMASVEPGVTFEPRHQVFDLLDGSGLPDCTSDAAPDITGGTFDGFSVVFPALDCSGTGAQGVGGGNVTWSDGSTSTLLARSVEMKGPLTARINLQVVGGAFEGASGGITVDATPLEGDCLQGITSEAFSGGVLTLR